MTHLEYSFVEYIQDRDPTFVRTYGLDATLRMLAVLKRDNILDEQGQFTPEGRKEYEDFIIAHPPAVPMW